MLSLLARIPGRIGRAFAPSPPVRNDDAALIALLRPIIAFAQGDEDRRDDAIRLHRSLLTNRPDLRSHPAQMFMAEVDTPSPDLGLRASSRQRLAAL